MSRKAREDKSSWLVPDIYVFAGDFGPFKARNNAPITDALVILTSTLNGVGKKATKAATAAAAAVKDSEDGDKIYTHPMHEYAGCAQSILLGEDIYNSYNYEDEKKQGGCDGWYLDKQFQRIIIVDVAAMVEAKEDNDNDARAEALNNMIQKEMESSEPNKGFGKQLFRLLQRLHLQHVTLAAEGDLCCLLLKLYDAFVREDRTTSVATDICLIHPNLPASFVNSVLVPMGNQQRRVPKSKQPMDVHLVFQDEKTRDKRLGMIRHVFPNGVTNIVSEGSGLSLLLSIFYKNNSSGTLRQYDPEFCDTMGRSLFLSTLAVEMNKYSKQYECTTEDVTADLLNVEYITNETDTPDVKNTDWAKCERHIGGLVLRGNRCVLVRSLSKKWDGMRLPSVVPKENESPVDTAIRAIVELTEVEASEVKPLEMISPVTVYAPNGRNIVMQLYPLYAAAPPPDGALEDADLEDDESPYDWYLFENAVNRLDERSIAALQSMSSILVEAANVGIVPCKWGGVFGQEAATRIATSTTDIALTVEAEEWKPSRQGDMLQDVRKANADILSRISASRKEGQPHKLPVTLLSGFLGSGKTTLMSHILANYEGLKIAILVNDMGEINIDAALLKKHSVSITQKEEHMVEMSNGCICCTLREDLLVEVAKIAAQGTFDYLLIESTGVSEPMPVAETFTFKDSTGLRLGDIAQIDTLVTVVDGSRFLSELDSIQTLKDRDWQADPEDQRTISHLLCDQVEFANVIIVNKCDQINVDERNQVKCLIQQMNPSAQLIESTFSKVPLDRVLGTGLFSMSDAERHDGWLKEARIGEHTPETLEYGISSFTYRARRPFWPHKLDLAFEGMLEQKPPFDTSIVLRSKGIVWLASFNGIQGEFSLAGNHFSLTPGNPWWAEIDKEHWPEGLEEAIKPLWDENHGDRQQEIVIIGQELDRDAITNALDACLLNDEEMALGEELWNHMSVDAGDPFYEDWYYAIEASTVVGGDGEHGHSHEHHHAE